MIDNDRIGFSLRLSIFFELHLLCSSGFWAKICLPLSDPDCLAHCSALVIHEVSRLVNFHKKWPEIILPFPRNNSNINNAATFLRPDSQRAIGVIRILGKSQSRTEHLKREVEAKYFRQDCPDLLMKKSSMHTFTRSWYSR